MVDGWMIGIVYPHCVLTTVLPWESGSPPAPTSEPEDGTPLFAIHVYGFCDIFDTGLGASISHL